MSSSIGAYRLDRKILEQSSAELWLGQADQGPTRLLWVLPPTSKEASAEGIARVEALRPLAARCWPRIVDVQARLLVMEVPAWLPHDVLILDPSRTPRVALRRVLAMCRDLEAARAALVRARLAGGAKAPRCFDMGDHHQGNGDPLLLGFLRRLWAGRDMVVSVQTPWLGSAPFLIGMELFSQATGQMAFPPSALVHGRFGDALSEAWGDLEPDMAHLCRRLMDIDDPLAEARRDGGVEDREPPELVDAVRWLEVYLVEHPGDHPEIDGLLLDTALEWAREKAYEGDLGAIRVLLTRRPEYGQVPAIAEYIWAHFEGALLGPLREGWPMPACYAEIIERLGPASGALVEVLEEEGRGVGARVSAALLLGSMGAEGASRALVRALNAPQPGVARAAKEALDRIGAAPPLGLDARRTRIVPCSQAWADMAAMDGGEQVRFCDKCATPVVRVQDLEALGAMAGVGCAFFDPPALTAQGALMVRATTGMSWSLAPGDRIRVGAQWPREIGHDALAPRHAEIEHLGGGQMAVRALDGEVHHGAVRVTEAIFALDERVDVWIGPLRLTRSGADQAVVVSGQEPVRPMMAGRVAAPWERGEPPLLPPGMPAFEPPRLAGAPMPLTLPPVDPTPESPEDRKEKSLWARFKELL